MIAYDPAMKPDVARMCIYSFFWQLSQHQDRRVLMNPSEAELQREQQAQLALQEELGWLQKVKGKAERFFSRERRLAYAQKLKLDAEAQARARNSGPGCVNHATGLPESPGDLSSGREVMRGEDLAMSACLPCWGLAASVTQTDDTEDGEWQALGYKPVRSHCEDCQAKGRTTGPSCTRCKGKGIEKSSIILALIGQRKNTPCTICRGRGRLVGPVCKTCEGQGTVQNWSDRETDICKHNTMAISREVRTMAEEGLLVEDPGIGGEEVQDLIWDDGKGNPINFRITHKGYKVMQEFMAERPELRKFVPLLEFAGSEVVSKAPQWAREKFNQERR